MSQPEAAAAFVWRDSSLLCLVSSFGKGRDKDVVGSLARDVSVSPEAREVWKRVCPGDIDSDQTWWIQIRGSLNKQDRLSSEKRVKQGGEARRLPKYRSTFAASGIPGREGVAVGPSRARA